MKKKLRLKKRTLVSLTDEQAGGVAGGRNTRLCTYKGGGLSG